MPSATESSNVHPAGVVWVAELLFVANSTSWSPAATDPGTVTVAEVVFASRTAPARKVGSAPGWSLTVTEVLADPVASSSSVTVSVTP